MSCDLCGQIPCNCPRFGPKGCCVVCGYRPCICAKLSDIGAYSVKTISDGEIIPAPLQLKVKKLHPEAKLPTMNHVYDAGYDLYCLEPMYLYPNIPTKIQTGIALHIPNGHVGLIWDRSGLSSKGIKVFGGVIDSGYRGEIMVCLTNLWHNGYQIQKNDKIAQILIQKVAKCDIIEVTELDVSERGESGFGSSGR